MNRESIQNTNYAFPLLQLFRKKASFSILSNLWIFWDKTPPMLSSRKVARIGKVVWCRILVTGILELISDFSNIKWKFKQKGNANFSRSNPLGHTLDCKLSVSGWCYFAHWTLLYHILLHTYHTHKASKQAIQVVSGPTPACCHLAWWIGRVCWVIGRRTWKEKVEKKSKRSVGRNIQKGLQGN